MLSDQTAPKRLLVSQGNLRASHRALGQAPCPNLGLPWHDHVRSELRPIGAGEPVELVFDLLPSAYRFAAGKCLRITGAFADVGSFETPVLEPAPGLEVLRDAACSASCGPSGSRACRPRR